MTQSPRYRKCTPALWRGLCGMPLALRLNEGLGRSARKQPVDMLNGKFELVAVKAWPKNMAEAI